MSITREDINAARKALIDVKEQCAKDIAAMQSKVDAAQVEADKKLTIANNENKRLTEQVAIANQKLKTAQGKINDFERKLESLELKAMDEKMKAEDASNYSIEVLRIAGIADTRAKKAEMKLETAQAEIERLKREVQRK